MYHKPIAIVYSTEQLIHKQMEKYKKARSLNGQNEAFAEVLRLAKLLKDEE